LLEEVRTHVEDLTAAALEVTGPKEERVLSKAEARRIIGETAAMLEAQIRAAQPPEPDPAYGGDCSFSFVLVRRRGL
jgi:hypothetical protein